MGNGRITGIPFISVAIIRHQRNNPVALSQSQRRWCRTGQRYCPRGVVLAHGQITQRNKAGQCRARGWHVMIRDKPGARAKYGSTVNRPCTRPVPIRHRRGDRHRGQLRIRGRHRGRRRLRIAESGAIASHAPGQCRSATETGGQYLGRIVGGCFWASGGSRAIQRLRQPVIRPIKYFFLGDQPADRAEHVTDIFRKASGALLRAGHVVHCPTPMFRGSVAPAKGAQHPVQIFPLPAGIGRVANRVIVFRWVIGRDP